MTTDVETLGFHRDLESINLLVDIWIDCENYSHAHATFRQGWKYFQKLGFKFPTLEKFDSYDNNRFRGKLSVLKEWSRSAGRTKPNERAVG